MNVSTRMNRISLRQSRSLPRIAQAPPPDGNGHSKLAAGVEVLHAPREFPEYHPGYYGVFLRDLDGHNVEAVHHG